MRSHESPSDPIAVAMVAEAKSQRVQAAPGKPARSALQPRLGLPAYDLAGVAVIAVGIAVAGAAFFLF
jgi:hypothetical protein